MFRKDFIWGAASSAYQIEGAAYEDGKGLSIWDVYSAQENKVYESHTGEVACDHYHRFKEDVALMKEMGIQVYRFSISWTRILPNGTGEVNQKGIDFYNALIDELIANGIEPFITLYHWDLPYELYKKGGWLNREIVTWFGEYAGVVSRCFSDRVKKYLTLNEPQCFIGLGCLSGIHAPGIRLPIKDTFLMAHHALMAHGNAVLQLRKNATTPIEVGYAPTAGMTYPFSESKEDIEAARKALFSMDVELDNWTWNVAWFSDPVFLGHYPEDGMKKFAQYLPEIQEGDMELISQPVDFMGQNIYNGTCVKAGEDGEPEWVKRYEGFPKTAANWPVTPKCLYWGPKFLYERYQTPIYITENGVACHDVIASDGKVHDPNRIDFLDRYMSELNKVIESGVDIRGYLQWCLTDNYEWEKGYSERFGLVYIDFPTQTRIIKDSGYWYRKVIETNGECLQGNPEFKKN